MPTPSVSPLTAGQPSYTIANSKAFVARFHLDINAFDVKSFTVTYAGGQAGMSATLVHVDTSTTPATRLSVPLPAGGTIGNYGIQAVADAAQLTCNITENGGGSVSPTEFWELRVAKPGPEQWALSLGDPFNTVVNWLASDPVAVLTVPATAFEQATVTLTASNAGGGTVAGTAPPELAPTYRWTHTGAIPILGLPATTTIPTHPITLPGVYEAVPDPLTVTTTFGDPTGIYGSFLHNTSAPAVMTVSQRPQHVVLVVDRSGSMSLENRYDNAKTASRVLIHLLAGLRAGVNAGDRVAIVAFEDETPGFRGGAPSSRIQTLLPLTAPAAAVTAVDDPGFAFGAPGATTPIGDGLVAAIDLLAGAGPIGDKRFTIILLTDGQENSGTVALVPASAVNGAVPFTTAVGPLHPARKDVLDPSRCRVFTVALGPTADQNVLHQLAVSIGAGEFQLVSNPADLAASFGHMLESSQTVNALPKSATPPPGAPDTSAPASAVYFGTEASADRLVLSVTPAPPNLTITGTLQLARFDGAAYVPEAAPVLASPSDLSVSVSKLPVVGGGNPIHWRLIHGADPASAGPLDPAQVQAYVDLHLLADVLLDQPAYQTGDRMTLTVRIRHDPAPVLGATVRAVLTAPAVSLGEELSTLGGPAPASSSDATPGTKPDDTRPGGKPDDGRHGDRPTWLEDRITALLAKHKWQSLPVSNPTGVFVDGTDELFDPEGDGNYTNTFARVFQEGTYTWQLTAEGLDANGNPFGRALTVATFASIKVDPQATTIEVTRVHHHPSGMLAAQVVITPADERHTRLGPGKDDQVIWALQDGTFEHVVQHQPAPVFTDGSYRRVVLHEPRQRPILQVKAARVLLPEIDVRRRLAGLDSAD